MKLLQYTYKPGDLVLCSARQPKPGENHKLWSKYDGPWTIMKKNSNTTYNIKNDKNINKVVHHNHLRRFISRKVLK